MIKGMKDKAIEVNIIKDLNNNNKERKLLLNSSNITGLSYENAFFKNKKQKEKGKLEDNQKKKKKYNTDLIFSNLNSSNGQNIISKSKSTLYQSLPKNEKIKYIQQKLMKNSKEKEPFDSLAVKRKALSLCFLIHQYDIEEKSKSIEENKIFKSPYPLLYCISNRKVGNNSPNLLERILTSENKTLSKKQENAIKNSEYSKIFEIDLNDILKNTIRCKSTLKRNSSLFKNDAFNLLKKSKKEKLPFLNKYIKSKFKNYNNNIFNRNERMKNLPSTTGFFSRQKHKLNLKAGSSTYYPSIDSKENNKNKNKQLKNVIQNFKNRTVCLNNYKNNFKNNTIINERNNKIIEEICTRKRKRKSEQKLFEIIQDISHLKFNNQIMPFYK